MDQKELKQFFVDVIEEYFAPNSIAISQKWEGGKLVMKPGGDQQEKDIPIEVFFKKITGLRESLRVLEQKLNNHPGLSTTDKASFQSYITKCYGSLTTFNVLFKNSADRFVGAGKPGGPESKDKMTLSEAKAKLGMNEYRRD